MENNLSTLTMTISWLIVLLCLLKYNNAKPAGIPIPPGVGELKSAVACEHQKAFILCPNIFNGIDIVSAMFGRKNHLECLPPGDTPASFCTEQEDQIKQQVKDLCQGEDKCEVSASNDFLAMEGTQICPQVSKYLEVKYRCVPKDKIANEDDDSPNVVTESVGGAQEVSLKSLPSETEILSYASSPSSLSSQSSEVQVLLGNAEDPPKDENGAIVEFDSQPNTSDNSQEITEPINDLSTKISEDDTNKISEDNTNKIFEDGTNKISEDDTNTVNETITKSEISRISKEEKEDAMKNEPKTESVLDDAEAQSRNDDKYW